MPAIDLAKLFMEVDKFTSQVLSIPAAANNPDVRKKLEFVEASKEQIKVAHAEDLARRSLAFGQLAAFEEKNKQEKEAAQKKAADRDAPATPLDGDALGDAMLRNLGFK